MILIHFSQSINTEYKRVKMEGFIDSIFLLRIVNKILENEMSWQLYQIRKVLLKHIAPSIMCQACCQILSVLTFVINNRGKHWGHMKDNVMHGKSIIHLSLLMAVEPIWYPALSLASHNFMKNWTYHNGKPHCEKHTLIEQNVLKLNK